MNHVGHERYCTSSIFRVEVCQYLQNRYSLSVGQTVLSGCQEGPISLTNVPNNSKLQKMHVCVKDSLGALIVSSHELICVFL